MKFLLIEGIINRVNQQFRTAVRTQFGRDPGAYRVNVAVRYRNKIPVAKFHKEQRKGQYPRLQSRDSIFNNIWEKLFNYSDSIIDEEVNSYYAKMWNSINNNHFFLPIRFREKKYAEVCPIPQKNRI